MYIRALFLFIPWVLVLVGTPSPSDACSYIDDTVYEDVMHEAYDPTVAPAPPIVTSARLRHYEVKEALVSDCGGSYSCGGGIPALELEVMIEGEEEYALFRVDMPNGVVVYGKGEDSADREERTLYLAGWDNFEDDITILVTYIDPMGRPSAPVEAVATREVTVIEEEGCSVGRGGPLSLILVLAALASTGLGRRRRARETAA